MTKDEAVSLAQEKDMIYVECSAKMNENVERVFTDLTARILEKISIGEIDPIKEMVRDHVF